MFRSKKNKKKFKGIYLRNVKIAADSTKREKKEKRLINVSLNK